MTVACSLFSACTGLFQDDLPERPATFHRIAGGDVLLVGAAEADITPTDPQYLAGFNPNRVSTGIHMPLKARAIVFEIGGMRLAIVGVDNLGLQRDDVDWIKSGITGYQNGCVMLCSSHTHSAPDLVGIWGAYFWTSGRDRDYLSLVRAGVAEAVAEATERARPAVLVRGEDRLPPQGLQRNSNRRGLFDRRVTVVQARDIETGEPLGTLLHLGCHPEVFRSNNTLVSPDFAGPLCDRWRSEGQGQAVFVNGALGAMVTPQPRGSEGMDYVTEILVAKAKGALAAAEPVPARTLEVRRSDVYMPVTSAGLLLGRLTLVLPRRAYDGQIQSTVGWLRIGSLEAACVPGEMEPTLAERIRRVTGKPDLLVFGLVDDELGYLMREVDARDPEFAYERSMSPVVDTGERVFEALTGDVAPEPQSIR